jgi:hypothetical protein
MSQSTASSRYLRCYLCCLLYQLVHIVLSKVKLAEITTGDDIRGRFELGHRD